MSSYGPPGGPYPGQPQEPWHDRPPQEYVEPTDPWGGQPSSGQPADPLTSPPPYQYDPAYYGAPAQYGPPPQEYGTAPEYGAAPPTGPLWQAPPEGPRRSPALIATIIAVLAILLVGGAAAAYIATDRNTSGGGGPTTAPPTDPTGGATSDSADVRSATEGQCVVNDGTNENPVMRVVPCTTKDAYSILKRFPETIDTNKCSTVEGYEYHYFYNSELDSLDYVLCLKKV
jgi:hypothetical protein